MSPPTWKTALGSSIPVSIGKEIDDFETDLELRRQGKSDEKLFNEARLRRGVYGQRYDNGTRHDGKQARLLAYPSGGTLKGPGTLWDAPGMQRIKIPFGAVTADQLDVLADLADEYSTGILHVTTRQDFQLHYIHIDDTPDIMRRLAAVGITTLEACGNSVRNVTACPLAGVCHEEPFDVTPHARALTHFLLGHPDAQDFGRKFKVSFSGCKDNPCGVAAFHDLGLIAGVREHDGSVQRGFELWVGGGLGPVPHQALLFDPFLPEEELLPISQAVCRVFARLGEKKNRARARLKFLVAQLGIDEFRRLVREERDELPFDPRWTAHLSNDDVSLLETAGSTGDSLASFVGAADDTPLRPPALLQPGQRPEGYEAWASTNVMRQSQDGYVVVAITLPLGDLSATQSHALAALARTYTGDTIRTSVEQNLLFRWLPEADLPDFYSELVRIGLAQPGAGSIVDVTSCPGTDTCKLGIASSRGLAGRLRERMLAEDVLADKAIKGLHIKISGCFNSCGQHHVADLGFYGVSRKVEGRTVPHFQVVLGGQWEENAAAFGLAIGAVPSKRIPEVVDRLTDWYRRDAVGDEKFREFVQRNGKVAIRAAIEDLMVVPGYEQGRDLYSDWGDPREFSVGDIGIGECAGEVISRFDFDLATSERQVFEAQVQFDEGDAIGAVHKAYAAMLLAADSLLRFEGAGTRENQSAEDDIETRADEVIDAFRTRFFDTGRFFDPFAGAKFANYLFALHGRDLDGLDVGAARAHVEEAQLFIEASHACHARLLEAEAQVPVGAIS